MATPPLPTPLDWKALMLEIIMIAATVASGVFTGNVAAALKAISALDQIITKALAAKNAIVGQMIDEAKIAPIDPV